LQETACHDIIFRAKQQATSNKQQAKSSSGLRGGLMLFSSLSFLFLFLPITLIIYHLLPKKKLLAKNVFLLAASLVFYAWGGVYYLALMLAVIVVNYVGAIWVAKGKKKYKLWLVIIANLGILFYFKYFNFAISILESITRNDINIFEVLLPIGISFYIFQALSYSIDVYLGKAQVQKNFFKLALYISLFPQLIAGPIVKYSDVCEQIDNRRHTSAEFYDGVRRFIYGLAKKVLIANTLGEVADKIFALHPSTIGTASAWAGIILYALQIYFDFSGYSCMAIGLGKMFGFSFKENFNRPYTATSVTDFWKRWHISLTSWFREYVYFPLGGNRKGTFRTYLNVVIIFLLSGLWHGANYTFIIWGAFYAFFMVVERAFLGNWLSRNRQTFFNWLYTIIVVCFAWVFFRFPDVGYAIRYIAAMLGWYGSGEHSAISYLTINSIIILPFAILFCGFIQNWVTALFSLKPFARVKQKRWAVEMRFWSEALCLVCLFVCCILMLANNTYNPFIYFQF
jgi:alginate O-acetyltransferase complex protein AlgI